MKQWYPINSFFVGEEIRYVHDGFILRDLGLCHGGWERYRVHGGVQKPSKAGHLIDHLAWRVPLFSLRQQDPPHQSGNQSQLFRAV